MQSISITPRSAEPKVVLTSAAAEKVAELIAKEGDESLALRLGVRPGGCSGFSYEMFFDSQIDDDKDIVSETDGVRLVVDAQSMEMLEGAEVDYRDTLQGAGFHINNPNVQRACGCGNSFS
jgi:iron-sulfur cluster assembly protein/iron-sulfur cluster insertion protein